jgi:DNA polymerase-4
MNDQGLLTFGDLQKYTKLDLINSFGDFGASIFNYCRGVDTRVVSSSGERKSLSVEHTFIEDKKDIESLEIELEACFEEMISRLTKHKDRKVKTIFVKIKYFDFTSTTIEAQGICDFNHFKLLFRKRFLKKSKAVRLIGVGVKFYSTFTKGQLELPISLCEIEPGH